MVSADEKMASATAEEITGIPPGLEDEDARMNRGRRSDDPYLYGDDLTICLSIVHNRWRQAAVSCGRQWQQE